MSRYIKNIRLDKPIDVVSMVMEDFVYHNCFSRTDWNGEMVYYLQDRHGRERYMKWAYSSGEFHVEAWLKNALGGEMDLDGIAGGVSRKEFRALMDELIVRLQNTGNNLSNGHVGADPLHHDNSHHTLRRAEQLQESAGSPGINSAMLLAIAGLFFTWSIPVVGIILAIVSIKKSEDAENPRQVKRIAGIVLVIAVLSSLYSIGIVLLRMGVFFL